MIFVLDATIGLGIWLPFTMGKTLALLSVRINVPFLLLESIVLKPFLLTAGAIAHLTNYTLAYQNYSIYYRPIC